MTSDRDYRAGRRGRSGWPCRWPGRSSRTWPSSTAPASARSSSAAPTSTPARPTRCSSRAGTPWRTSARPAPSGPGRCGRRSAGKAGTSRTNPTSTPDPATEDQQWWVEKRAEAQQLRDQADAGRAGHRPTWTSSSPSWTRRSPRQASAGRSPRPSPARRHRSTRRRQDAPDLPRRKVSPRTVGKTYTAPDGKTFRPSLFVTLTCPSYGRVGEDGAPADPGAYDYDRAARDALTFAALFDRFIQNLRRYLGYDVQYFAAIEPQRRLAPHVHIAIRGTVSRAELRRVLAATYHQVWWPDASEVKYDGDELPVWDEAIGGYLDPATGEVLPTWDQALDAIGDEDEPWHVARFGVRFDAQGVLAGSKDAARCIGYLTKYLTKQVGDCHQADTDAAAGSRRAAG